jgi:hypothetical protein
MPSLSSVKITVNKGQRHELTFAVHPEMKGQVAGYYRQIYLSDRAVWINDNINIFEIAIGGTFDFAIPQGLWDRLFELGGAGAVRGVYCYDTTFGPEYKYGKFMHFNDALEIASKKIAEAYKEASNG